MRASHHLRFVLPALAALATAAALLVSLPSSSQTVAVTLAAPISAQTSAAYINQPITTVESAPPVVMLNMTRDHQLFYKAYNDYSDLDNDGAPETTYKHSINYYGYFDSAKCYTYSSSNGRFEPSSLVDAQRYCNASGSSQWSGNFLNWAAMTRMDAVRKLLYGGSRVPSLDTATGTVLERTTLTTDAHSFAKYYNGTDIARLTPFTGIANTNASTTSSSSNNSQTGSKVYSVTLASLRNPSIGDQIRIVRTSDTSVVLDGYVTAVADGQITVQVYNTSASSNTARTDWTLTNLSSSGISFCNTTWAASGQQSHSLSTATYPPLLRVARGNFELWGANERWQCYWRDEKHTTAAFTAAGGATSGRNGNLGLFSGLNASNASPRKTASGSEPQHALGTGSNAGASGSNGEYIVRVSACVAGLEGNERCKSYPSGVKKPIGLLQVYGDDDRIRFGLMTSSYQRNVSGGVLRKNATSFRDETNEDSNGTFSTVPTTGGIVDTIEKLRIWGYRYGADTDTTDAADGDNGTYKGSDRENCDFQLVGIAATGTTIGTREVAEGQCASWGNPVGEVYLESLRYLGGLAASTAFDYSGTTNNKDGSLGLPRRTFTDPVTSSNYCANLNVLTFTASVSSFDNDQMGGLSGLRGGPSAATFTDQIGAAENIHGANWFIGNAPGNVNQLCTGKTINNLSAVDGICPEASAIEGSFLIGGAALYARTNRIRNDFPAAGIVPAVPPTNDTTSFKVTSYGIELATNTPNITLTQPGTGRKVSIQPVYRLDRSSTGAGPFGSGAIVDFRIVSQDVVNGRGRFYVNWEDSTQGGDYDQDMYGVIDYEFLSGDRIKITTKAVNFATENGQGFGYIISGTTKDGPHFHSGILNYDYLGESASNPITVLDPLNRVLNNTSYPDLRGGAIFISTSGGCQNCTVNDPPTSVIYNLGDAPAGALKSPLYYMAKYGGFTDRNGNNLPDLPGEWDVRDANGNIGTDGVPDTYFLVSNPNALETSLRAALDAIIAKTASGTAAAVVSNAQEGQGAVYQALYESSRTDANGNNVRWIGSLQGLFIDAKGRLREDNNGDATLLENNFSTDPAVEAFFDPSDRTTKLRRFTGDPANGNFVTAPLSSLKTIWNARDQLSAVTDAATQREYGSLANTGRYIFTHLDLDRNGVVAPPGVVGPTSPEVLDFVPATFNNTLFGVLNVSSKTDADNVVNYVRGVEITGLRSRRIDYNGDGTLEVMRLGDIAQSTPTPVGAPAESFNLLYNDSTYNSFARKYAKRRNVVYVGANDGMLHAFNGGFFDTANKRFVTSLNGEVAHPLGSELWAYIPFNLLPHLRWLTENDYGHVYYMDGKPKVADVRIFTPESACSDPTAAACIHPGGWGTIMVVGMRLGGDTVDLDTTNGANVKTEFTGFGTPPDPLRMRSAYVVLDITNPEQPPTVLAEITEPTGKMGFSTAVPTVAAFSQRGVGAATNVTSDQWYLVFGNGPNVASSSASSQQAGVFVYDLKTKGFVSGYAPKLLDAAMSNSFVGDPVAVDWDLSFKNDALYFGTASGTAASPGGKLYRINTNNDPLPANWPAPEVLLDAGGPVTATPSVTIDEANNRWVYAGSGRFYVQGDKTSTPRQSLFGVIDSQGGMAAVPPAAKVAFSDLLNTTTAVVTRAGAVSGVTTPSGCTTIDSEVSLGNCAVAKKGWKYLLGNGSPSERIVNRTTVFGEVLFATAFTPSPTLCQGEGNSRLLGLYFKTGAPRAAVPTFGTTLVSGTEVVTGSVDLGQGLAAGIALHRDTVVNLNSRPVSIISQTSTAALTNTKGNLAATAGSGEIDWRDSRRSR